MEIETETEWKRRKEIMWKREAAALLGASADVDAAADLVRRSFPDLAKELERMAKELAQLGRDSL